MAFISAVSTLDSVKTLRVAFLTLPHQSSGCCSAQPLFGAMIGISFSGEIAEATTAPLCVSSNVALTDEVPQSYPNTSIPISLTLLIKPE